MDSSPSDEDASPSGGGVTDLYVLLDRKWKEMQLIEEELRNSILAQVGAGAGESGDGAEDPVHASLSKETVLVYGFATRTGAFVTSEGTSPGVSTLSLTFFVLVSLVFLCIVRMCLPRLVSHDRTISCLFPMESFPYFPFQVLARLRVAPLPSIERQYLNWRQLSTLTTLVGQTSRTLHKIDAVAALTYYPLFPRFSPSCSCHTDLLVVAKRAQDTRRSCARSACRGCNQRVLPIDCTLCRSTLTWETAAAIATLTMGTPASAFVLAWPHVPCASR